MEMVRASNPSLHVANSAPVVTLLDTSEAFVIVDLSFVLEISSWFSLRH